MFGSSSFSAASFSQSDSGPNAVFEVSGVSTTGTVGSVTTTLGAGVSVSVTGVAATMPVVAIDAGGSLFGGIAFGEEPFAELEDTGLKVVIREGIGVPVTGVEGTGAVGSVSIALAPNISVTGVAGTGGVGSVTITEGAGINVAVTGISATGGVGSASVVGDANVSVVGVSADALKPNNGSAFTANGNAQLSTAQAKFGPSSLLLDGTDDFVTSDENIDLSSGDFTVDMWIRPTNVTGYKGIWQTGTSTTEQSYLLGNQVYWVVNPSTIISSSVTVSAGVWTMLSYEREGNVHRIYKNGTLEDTFTTSNKPDNGVFSVGKNGFGDFNGYIDEVRLSSVARYEGTSFTEPTANYAKIIGICLKNINQNNKLFSATKVWTPVTKHGEQQIKNSFDLWGQDQFSLIQVHNLVNYKDHLEKLSNLKQQKKIKYIGVTTSHGNKHKLLIDIMNKEDIDFVQFTYNILDDEAEQKLLPLAKEKKIAVIVNRPFQGGSLFDYTKNKQIPKWVKEYGIRSWSEFFLKFTTSHPAVTCSIPATSKLDHMKENMQSLYGDLPDEKARMRMKQFFKSLV